MARPRDDSLRNRLLDAATAEFASRGYAGATLEGIGERAGVTKGGVYFHFRGKEALFFSVLDHWREVRRRRLQVPAIGSEGAAAALRAFLAAYLGFHFHEPEATHLLRVLATELRGRFTARLREDDRQEQRWLRASVRDLLVQGANDGTLLVEDPAFEAFLLAASLTGILEQWHAAPGDVEAFCHEEQLARALVARYATGTRTRGRQHPEFDFRDRAEHS
jgi:AcrR family transcriptional regulator